MQERKQKLLGLVIEHYINTSHPVGSQFLADSTELKVSGATIRNELRDLEQEGYLTHPHTSAGRIPTEKGYRHYVEHIAKPKKIAKKVSDRIGELKQSDRALKDIAKHIAETIETAVFVFQKKQSAYYTGISQLFSQPEFRDYARTVKVSAIFDHCEEHMDRVYDLVQDDITVLIGSDNPLGSGSTLIATRFDADNIFLILGPMRMDYKTNLGIISHLHTHL